MDKEWLVQSGMLHLDEFLEKWASKEQRDEFLAERERRTTTGLEGETLVVFPLLNPHGFLVSSVHMLYKSGHVATCSSDGIYACSKWNGRGYFKLNRKSALFELLAKMYDFDKMQVGAEILRGAKKLNFVGLDEEGLYIQDWKAMRNKKGKIVEERYGKTNGPFEKSAFARKKSVRQYFSGMELWFKEQNRLAEKELGLSEIIYAKPNSSRKLLQSLRGIGKRNWFGMQNKVK